MITITVSGDVQQSTNPNGDLVLTVADAARTGVADQIDVSNQVHDAAEAVAHAAEVEAETFVAPVVTDPASLTTAETPVTTPTTPVEGV